MRSYLSAFFVGACYFNCVVIDVSICGDLPRDFPKKNFPTDAQFFYSTVGVLRHMFTFVYRTIQFSRTVLTRTDNSEIVTVLLIT